MSSLDPGAGLPSGRACGPIDSAEVAAAHNTMAADYDRLDDLWYPWLFAQVHELIAAQLPSVSGVAGTTGAAPTAFDAGCGTGFQSFLLARAGYRVTGLDLATDLIDVARRKIPSHAQPPLTAPPLFEAPSAPWLERHHASLSLRLDELRAGRPVLAPVFGVGDLQRDAFEPGGFDVITCCGSVLSFLDEYEAVMARLAGALRPGGLLFIEVEQRYSLDLLWPIVDRLVGGRLDYEQPWEEIRTNLFAPPDRSVRVDYPFPMADGGELTLPIWLFSVFELQAIFRRHGLEIVRQIGIHQATNLLPSTVLHHAPTPLAARAAFAILRRVDKALAARWPAAGLGCGVAFALRRCK